MALKMQVSNLEEVPEAFRSEYSEVVEGDVKVFKLSVDGAEDVGALKRAHERVKEEARLAKEDARRKGEDFTNMEKSYNEKIEQTRKAADEALVSTQKALKHATKDKTSQELLADLGVDEHARKLLLPHVETRLKVEIVDDRPIVRVLGPDGKMSAMSVEDLKKEFREDKAFASVITAGRGSGSGAGQGSQIPGDAGHVSETPPPNDPRQLSAWAEARRTRRGRN